ncbi:hypothetical protein Srufu_007530 [Streptomyces libani subsp. rufus]|nr:hypothetical protein Srufu_007530 [Streptomyces libani subsp. rufus]
MDHGLGPVADEGVGVDAFPAAGEGPGGRRGGGSGWCGSGAEGCDGDERESEQGGADTGVGDAGHEISLVSWLVGGVVRGEACVQSVGVGRQWLFVRAGRARTGCGRCSWRQCLADSAPGRWRARCVAVLRTPPWLDLLGFVISYNPCDVRGQQVRDSL